MAEEFRCPDGPAGKVVALFGGSFNPPHVGHVMATACVLSTARADEVWWLPTFRHAFGKELAPFELRCRMAEAALGIFDPTRVRVERVEEEVGRDGRPTYTVDVLRVLVERQPGTRFLLVVGTDVLAERDQWRAFDEVERLAGLLVVGRQGHPAEPGREPEVWIPDISSSLVRERIRRGEPVDRIVPASVLELIRTHGLYSLGQGKSHGHDRPPGRSSPRAHPPGETPAAGPPTAACGARGEEERRSHVPPRRKGSRR